MTSKKQLKRTIRARMGQTGESYLTARRHVVGSATTPHQPYDDHGYLLRGGAFPDSAAVANVLAHHGVTVSGTPIPEPLIFGIGGGLGAGYILWEFDHGSGWEHGGAPDRALVLGFSHQWQYAGRLLEGALDRLGVPYDVHTTSGSKGATARLDAELAAGRPAIVLADRQLLGYWHLPSFLEAHGGHPIVVHGADAGRLRVDDRTFAPLTVARQDADAARGRVSSYKNRLTSIRPDTDRIAEERLAQAVRAGLATCVEHLSAGSDSFSLPAWRKWARLLTDQRNPKAWPKVFADRRGLVRVRLSIFEGIEPVGTSGGCLRGLYAEFLDQAADLLGEPKLRAVGDRFRDVAAQWHELAELAVPVDQPEFARIRELTATVIESVQVDGDAGAGEARAASEELWSLRAKLGNGTPWSQEQLETWRADLSSGVTAIYEAERAAIAELATI